MSGEERDWIEEAWQNIPTEFSRIEGWHGLCGFTACHTPAIIVKHGNHDRQKFNDVGEVGSFHCTANDESQYRVRYEAYGFRIGSRPEYSVTPRSTAAIIPAAHMFVSVCAEHLTACSYYFGDFRELYLRTHEGFDIHAHELLQTPRMLAHLRGKVWFDALASWIWRNALFSREHAE